MADWFKFYENGIYESRFQWAVHEESGVCPVWVWILSECCKHKSGYFGWKGTDCELFGVSHVVNVTAPKVNQAINLLVKIGYISLEGATIKVLQWNKFQSDYMRKKDHRESGQYPDNVRTKTEKVVLEERRVEEKRVDKKEEYSEGFLLFYSIYPRKEAKGSAWKAWKACKFDSRFEVDVTESLKKQLPSLKTKEMKFIKLPATWLNGRCWEDELDKNYRPDSESKDIRKSLSERGAQ